MPGLGRVVFVQLCFVLLDSPSDDDCGDPGACGVGGVSEGSVLS